jgi:hypothetical protein
MMPGRGELGGWSCPCASPHDAWQRRAGGMELSVRFARLEMKAMPERQNVTDGSQHSQRQVEGREEPA